VDKLDDYAVVIKGRIRTKPINLWEVGRAYLRCVKQAFDRENIEIPFPHTSLYFGEAGNSLEVHTARTDPAETAHPKGSSENSHKE